METTLNDHYCNVGKQLLEMAEREDQEINNLVDKIIDVKKQLSALRQ
jgi:predicted DNA-binding ribbon-helix-helix protein